MNEPLERLLVTIEGSAELLRQELRKGGVDTERWARDTEQRVGRVDSTFKKLGSSLRTTLASFGIGLSVGAITAFTRSQIQAADAIGEAARAAGFGAENFQRLQFVFGQNGVEANEFGGALRTLNTRLGQFVTTGTGPAADSIRRLGLEQRIARGELNTSEKLFNAIVEELAKVESAHEAAAIASGFFGRELGARLAPVLREGAAALEQMKKAATGVFTDEQTANANKIADATERIWKAVKGAVGGELINATAVLGQTFGVDEFRSDELTELDLRERGIRSGAFTGTAEARERQLAEIAEKRRYLQLINTPFIPPASGGPIPGLRADGRPSESSEGLSDIRVGAGRINSAAELRERRRRMGIRTLSPDIGLGEIGVRARTLSSADEFFSQRRAERESSGMRAFPLDNQAIERMEEYADAVEKARERQQRFGDAIAASFESRGWDALINGEPRDAIRGLIQDFAELTVRIALLQPLAQALAASLSGIGFLGGGGGGASGGGIAGFFGKIFGGKRHSGGPVSAGIPYLVRPDEEFFVPDVAGQVKTRSQARAAARGGPSISISVDARGATDPAAVEASAYRGAAMALSAANAYTDARLSAIYRPSHA